ncbi:unnamed protein product [marine sediment metagenome]|uniref:Uncharacterized protein n=1 Tax=marine sediment metagenome TaxID=412755 RepID=X1EIU1_9ZZZZ
MTYPITVEHTPRNIMTIQPVVDIVATSSKRDLLMNGISPRLPKSIAYAVSDNPLYR